MLSFSNVQMFRCLNVKFQISIRWNFCWSVPPEFLRSFLSLTFVDHFLKYEQIVFFFWFSVWSDKTSKSFVGAQRINSIDSEIRGNVCTIANVPMCKLFQKKCILFKNQYVLLSHFKVLRSMWNFSMSLKFSPWTLSTTNMRYGVKLAPPDNPI